MLVPECDAADARLPWNMTGGLHLWMHRWTTQSRSRNPAIEPSTIPTIAPGLGLELTALYVAGTKSEFCRDWMGGNIT